MVLPERVAVEEGAAEEARASSLKPLAVGVAVEAVRVRVASARIFTATGGADHSAYSSRVQRRRSLLAGMPSQPAEGVPPETEPQVGWEEQVRPVAEVGHQEAAMPGLEVSADRGVTAGRAVPREEVEADRPSAFWNLADLPPTSLAIPLL